MFPDRFPTAQGGDGMSIDAPSLRRAGVLLGVLFTVGATSACEDDPPQMSVAVCEHRDRQALVAFYNAMDGEHWLRSENWLTDEPAGEWYGVTAESDGCVTRVELGGNDLAGEIPAELESLRMLESLDLSDNHLNGEVPEQLANLPRLIRLYIGGNRFTGCIPGELRFWRHRASGTSPLAYIGQKLAELAGYDPGESDDVIPGNDLKYLDVPFCPRLPPADPELLRAVEKGEPDLVRSLIASGAGVNTEDPSGDPLLYRAIWDESLEIAQILIGAGADVNAKTYDDEPLLYSAIFWNKPGFAQILVDANADTNARTVGGDPLLYEAMWFGTPEIAQVLIGAGADVNVKSALGHPLLYHPVRLGEPEFVQILVDADADVNVKSGFGESMLAVAIRFEHAEIVQILTDAGAER